VFVHEKTFTQNIRTKLKGTPLTENDDYDIIFAALKNPMRRQILVLLEQKGEATFTDIQNALNVTDTGLLSYHLKELGVLVCQSSRGKYSLSEIGQTSMALFNKVEKDKEQTRKIVQKEVDSYINAHFKESLILIGFVVASLCAPLAVDIFVSVNIIVDRIQLWQIALLQLVAFSDVTLCLALFSRYNRYKTKSQKNSIIRTTLFAVAISAVLFLSGFSTYNFTQQTTAMAPNPTDSSQLLLTITILRVVAYLASAPLIAYAVNKKTKGAQKTAFS
jgi:DNA-binding transcriptional ArsR family regulator